MKPVKRKVSSYYCLLCCTKCHDDSYQRKNKRSSKLAEFGVDIVGGENCIPLVNQLEQMFILLKILEIPTSWCSDNILARKDGQSCNDNWDAGGLNWFSVCGECIEKSVAKCWKIYQQISVLQAEMASVTRKVKQEMRKGVEFFYQNANRMKTVGEGTIDYDIRKFLFPDLFIKSEMSVMESQEVDGDCYYHEEDDDISFSISNEDIKEDINNDATTFKITNAKGRSRMKRQKTLRKKGVQKTTGSLEKTYLNRYGILKRKRFHWAICKDCGSRFKTQEGFNAHRRAHEEVEANGNEFVCVQCSFPARSIEELESHKSVRHTKRVKTEYFCPKCSLRLYNWKHLKQHVNKEHPNMTEDELTKAGLILKCHLCGDRQFETLLVLKIHQKRMHPEQVRTDGNSDKGPIEHENEDDEFFITNEDFNEDDDAALSITKTRLKMKREKTSRKKRIGKATTGALQKTYFNRYGVLKRKRFHWSICADCGSRFKTQEELSAHQRAHEEVEANGGEFVCSQCKFPARSTEELEFHKSVRHFKRLKTEYVCPKCTLRVYTWKHLKQHVDKEHPNMTEDELTQAGLILKCHLCGDRQFETLVLLKNHQSRMHPEELRTDGNNDGGPITCPECGIKFTTRKSLQNHDLNTHKLHSKFVCDECGKGFNFQSKLDRHKKTHLDRSQKQHVICDLCGLDFMDGVVLKKHYERFHLSTSNETSSAYGREFKCRYCPLTSSFSTVIKRHLESHKSEIGHQCQQCGRSYTSAQGLSRHIRINHSNEAWPCPYCSKVFPCEEYMKDHIKKFCKLKHGMQPKMKEECEIGPAKNLNVF